MIAGSCRSRPITASVAEVTAKAKPRQIVSSLIAFMVSIGCVGVFPADKRIKPQSRTHGKSFLQLFSRMHGKRGSTL